MTAKQRKVLDLLSGGAVLTVAPGFAVHKSESYGVHGDGDDLAVSLFWRDHDDCEWTADFTEDALSEAALSRGLIRLVDTLSQTVELTKCRCVPC